MDKLTHRLKAIGRAPEPTPPDSTPEASGAGAPAAVREPPAAMTGLPRPRQADGASSSGAAPLRRPLATAMERLSARQQAVPSRSPADPRALPPASPHEIIANALPKTFDAESLPPGEERERQLAGQRQMEREYIDAMASVLKARQAAFGGEGRYALDHDPSNARKEPSLPALYEASVSRAAAGTTAGIAQPSLQQALARRAKLAAFAGMNAMDLAALVPDPSPVQLRIVHPGNSKTYARPAAGASATGPAVTDPKNEAARRRAAIALCQQRLDALRRPASSTTAAVGEFRRGGKNGHLFAVDVEQEARSRAVPSSRPTYQASTAEAVDALRAALANATAGAAPRAQRVSLVGFGDEPLRPGAFLLQQFGRSSINDPEWNSSKDYLTGGGHDLAAELDRSRERKQHALLRAVDHTRAQVFAGVQAFRRGAPLTQAVSAALDDVGKALMTEGAADAGRLRTAMAALGRAATQEGAPAAKAIAEILAGVDAAARLSAQHRQLAAWRRPAAEPPAGHRPLAPDSAPT